MMGSMVSYGGNFVWKSPEMVCKEISSFMCCRIECHIILCVGVWNEAGLRYLRCLIAVYGCFCDGRKQQGLTIIHGRSLEAVGCWSRQADQEELLPVFRRRKLPSSWWVFHGTDGDFIDFWRFPEFWGNEGGPKWFALKHLWFGERNNTQHLVVPIGFTFWVFLSHSLLKEGFTFNLFNALSFGLASRSFPRSLKKVQANRLAFKGEMRWLWGETETTKRLPFWVTFAVGQTETTKNMFPGCCGFRCPNFIPSPEACRFWRTADGLESFSQMSLDSFRIVLVR